MKRTDRARARLSGLVLVGLVPGALVACAGSTGPAGPEPGVVGTQAELPRQVDRPAPLTDVLFREPLADPRCPAAFPRAYRWEPGAPGADDASLRRAVWLEPGEARETPIVAETEAGAEAARCFASGPHRDLDLTNWCCRRDPEAVDVPPPADSGGLVATLSADRTAVPSEGDIRLAVAIENRGPAPLDLSLRVASSNMLLLDVLDARGSRVPTIPPPTPRAGPEPLTLPPQGGRTFQHHLRMFSPALPPGEYEVRVREPSIASGSLRFTVGGGERDEARTH